MKLNLGFKVFVITVMTSSIFFLACSGIQKKGVLVNMEVDEFAEVIQSQDTVIIINVGGSGNEDIFIQGAVAYPVATSDDAVMLIQEYGVNNPYAVYDVVGVKSKKAAELLSDKGANVYNLKNGLMGWIEADEEFVLMPLDQMMTTPIVMTKTRMLKDSVMMQKMMTKMGAKFKCSSK